MLNETASSSPAGQRKNTASRAQNARRAGEALKAKLAAMPPAERAAYKEKCSQAIKRGGAGAPTRAKIKTVAEMKQLFLAGVPDAIEIVWRIMKFSKSESLKLAAADLWFNRALGKAAQPIVGDGDGGPVRITFGWCRRDGDDEFVQNMNNRQELMRKYGDGNDWLPPDIIARIIPGTTDLAPLIEGDAGPRDPYGPSPADPPKSARR